MCLIINIFYDHSGNTIRAGYVATRGNECAQGDGFYVTDCTTVVECTGANSHSNKCSNGQVFSEWDHQCADKDKASPPCGTLTEPPPKIEKPTTYINS